MYRVEANRLLCKLAELNFRFNELEDELKDGCITLKVRTYFSASLLCSMWYACSN